MANSEKRQMVLRQISRRAPLMVFPLVMLTLSTLSGLAQEAVDGDSTAVLPKNQVVATVSVQQKPVAVAVSPDSSTVYVATQASNPLNFSNVTVIDATNNYTIKATIVLSELPQAVAVSPDGKNLYVGSTYGSVFVIDTTQSTYPITKTLSVNYPVALAVSPDGKVLYVANSEGYPGFKNTIVVFDTATYTPTSINCTGTPTAILFTENGAQADILNIVGTGFVQFLNTATGTIAANVGAAAAMPYPNGMTCDANATNGTGNLYLSSLNYVTVCDSTTGKVSKKILAVPSVFSSIFLGNPAVTPTGQYLYVPYPRDGNTFVNLNLVVMISTKTGKVVGTPITVGQEPIWAQISPDAKRLYVLNEADNTVSVVDITP
jgi:DNA-binding beta-propeller fold protein YncE